MTINIFSICQIRDDRLIGGRILEIKLNDSFFSIDNDAKVIETFWKDFINKLVLKKLIIKELYINETPLYKDYFETIISNLQVIKSVNIITVAQAEVCTDLLASLVGYLNNLPPYLEDIANGFYMEPSSDTWQKFQQLLEGIDWIISAIRNLSDFSDLLPGNVFTSHLNSFNGLVLQILEVVEAKDYFYLGDLLNYDLLDLVNSTLDALINTFPNKMEEANDLC